MTALRVASICVLVMLTRTVWPLNAAASLPLAMIRILPSSSCWRPNGGADQPMSIWLDMTCVSGAAGRGGGGGLGVGFFLVQEGGHEAGRRRAVGRVGDGLAVGIFKRLDRRSRRHIPEEI